MNESGTRLSSVSRSLSCRFASFFLLLFEPSPSKHAVANSLRDCLGRLRERVARVSLVLSPVSLACLGCLRSGLLLPHRQRREGTPSLSASVHWKSQGFSLFLSCLLPCEACGVGEARSFLCAVTLRPLSEFGKSVSVSFSLLPPTYQEPPLTLRTLN